MIESAAPNKSALRSQTEIEDSAPDRSAPRKMPNIEQVLQIVPVSQVTLWRMERKGRFPRGTFISPNKKIWFEEEITRWQDEINGRGRGHLQHPTRKREAETAAEAEAQ